jgi:hypothetical protein
MAECSSSSQHQHQAYLTHSNIFSEKERLHTLLSYMRNLILRIIQPTILSKFPHPAGQLIEQMIGWTGRDCNLFLVYLTMLIR